MRSGHFDQFQDWSRQVIPKGRQSKVQVTAIRSIIRTLTALLGFISSLLPYKWILQVNYEWGEDISKPRLWIVCFEIPSYSWKFWSREEQKQVATSSLAYGQVDIHREFIILQIIFLKCWIILLQWRKETQINKAFFVIY